MNNNIYESLLTNLSAISIGEALLFKKNISFAKDGGDPIVCCDNLMQTLINLMAHDPNRLFISCYMRTLKLKDDLCDSRLNKSMLYDLYLIDIWKAARVEIN